MDFSKLSQNNMIAAGGGIVAFIASILPWYSFDFGGFDVPGIDSSISAWGSGIFAWGGCLLALAAGVLIALKAMDVFEANVAGLATEQLAMILAAVGFLFVILRFLTATSLTSFGLYLGILATGATAAGAFLSGKDAGIGIPTADDFKGTDGGGDSTGGSPSTF